jgi:hypothetical protein
MGEDGLLGAGGAAACSPRAGGPVSFAAEVTVVEYLLSREEREDKQAAFRQISRRKQSIKRQRAASPEFDLAQALRERPAAARRPHSARLEEGFRRLLIVAKALGAEEPESAEADTPATPMLHFYRSPAAARCEAAPAAPAPQLAVPCEEEEELEGSEVCFDPEAALLEADGALSARSWFSADATPAAPAQQLPAPREPGRGGRYSPPPTLSLRPRSQLRRRLWQGEPEARAAEQEQEPEAGAARVGPADAWPQDHERETSKLQPLDPADGSPLELEFEAREPQPLEHLLFPHPPHQPALHPLFAAIPPAAPAAFISIRSERLCGAPDEREAGDADAAPFEPGPRSPPPPQSEPVPPPAARKSRVSPKASLSASPGDKLAASARSRALLTSWELAMMTLLRCSSSSLLISALFFSVLDRTANAGEHVKKTPAIAYA